MLTAAYASHSTTAPPSICTENILWLGAFFPYISSFVPSNSISAQAPTVFDQCSLAAASAPAALSQPPSFAFFPAEYANSVSSMTTASSAARTADAIAGAAVSTVHTDKSPASAHFPNFVSICFPPGIRHVPIYLAYSIYSFLGIDYFTMLILSSYYFSLLLPFPHLSARFQIH